MDTKKNITIGLIFTILFLLLGIRLFYFQIIKGPVLSKAASNQRIINYSIESIRGNILDKNGIPFTNRAGTTVLVLKPMYMNIPQDELKELCNIMKADYSYVKRRLEAKAEPVLIKVDEAVKNQILKKGYSGISAVNTLERYGRDTIAVHTLGYLNESDKVGQCGIEKEFNDVLEHDLVNMVGAVTDGRRNVLKGMGYRIIELKSKNKRLNVKLTLDYHIQAIVEEAMDKRGITGAVVVEEVNTGNIIAMASKKDYDPNNIGLYLDSIERELFNRAVASYNLGSIFKIIGTAAALEKGYEPQTYYCRGYEQVGSLQFKCTSYDRGGHGFVNLQEAFAHSCNAFFIKMALETGYAGLVEMAGRFGLGRKTGINGQGIDESAGNIPLLNRYYSDGDIANISIGQGEVLATPLQVADMVAAIANGGIKNRINIVDSIVDDSGNKIRQIRFDSGERIVEKSVADKIKGLMEKVVDYGTGKNIELESYGGAAGKTGSAETGRSLKGEEIVHAWFAGYFPRRNPRYAVSVFVENGKYGGKAAAPIFEEIALEIMKKGL